jgi:hypothetical protein
MTLSSARTRKLAALAVCACAGVFMAAPQALAAPHPTGAVPAPAPALPHGFFESTGATTTRITSSQWPAALLRDGKGGQHLITTVHKTAKEFQIVYLTRKPGATHWTSHAVRGLRPDATAIEVEAHLNVSGIRIFVVLYQCNGEYVTDAPIGSARLPKPPLVRASAKCSEADSDNAAAPADNPPVERAVALGAREVGVLEESKTASWSVWEGKVGAAFVAGPALPTAHQFRPQQISRDPSTGRIVVDGYGFVGNHGAVYVVTLMPGSSTWTAPKRIALAQSTNVRTDFVLDSLTSLHAATYVGLENATASASGHGLFIVRRNKSGQWTHPAGIPHTTAFDSGLRLAASPRSGHLHAAWTRNDPGSKTTLSGVMQEVHNAEGWTKPTFFSHDSLDIVDEITITAAGHAIIGYQQRRPGFPGGL